MTHEQRNKIILFVGDIFNHFDENNFASNENISIYRKQVEKTFPTSFHQKIKLWELALKYNGYDLHVMTQTTDDLFEKVDIKKIHHLQGEITHMKCLDCKKRWKIDYNDQKNCMTCNSSNIKTDVFFIGEEVPTYSTEFNLLRNLSYDDFFISVGVHTGIFPIVSFLRNTKPVKIYSESEKSIYHELYDFNCIGDLDNAIDSIIYHVNEKIDFTNNLKL